MISKIRWWSLTPEQSQLRNYFYKISQKSPLAKEIVLVQCVEDLYYFGLFGQMAASLQEKNKVRVEQFVLRSLREGESKSFLSFVISRVLINPLHNFKWEGLYGAFCDGVAYRSTSFLPISDVIDLFEAWKCWKSLTDKESLIAVNIENINVGDLVNDSFLRYKPAPTVNLKDFFLLILLWQTYRDVRRAQNYFKRVKPKLFLTSYSTYIQHGIPVRIALENGIEVFSFGNYQEFSKKLSLQDRFHGRNADSYASDFLKLEQQEEKLALAEAALTARISGSVDSATAYMKKSAYAESGEQVPDVLGAVVVFLHDFYDSPHVYAEMIFPDFWEWVCFTIETLSAANIRFFLKPHPNQLAISAELLPQLEKLYSGISLISPAITNKQLVLAGMSCAVTVYGTVAHEMAFLGVPTIACAHHPHISFDFCRTAHNREEYAHYLKNSYQIVIEKDFMHRQSLMFYYMHNLNLSEEMHALDEAVMKFRLACQDKSGDSDLVLFLNKIASLEGYQYYTTKIFSPILQSIKG